VRIRGSQFFQDPDRTMKPLIEELDHMGVRPQKTDAKEPESDEQDTESLKDRVLRRAYELKLEWRSKETPEAPLDAPERILASPKGESEDQKRAARVTEAERQYLKRLFRPACSSVVFKPEEWHDLQRYGSYMEALSSGDLKPRTEAQTQFVTVFTEGREPQSKYEKLWWRYLERKKWEADPENRAAMGPLRKLDD
jgi:hypothetical protein